MKNLLAIIANPGITTTGIDTANAFMEAYKQANPTHTLTTINLFNISVPELNGHVLTAWDHLAKGKEFLDLSDEQQFNLCASEKLLNQFLDHEKYLMVTPRWNYSVPARFHNYLDLLCVPRKTFQYTANGPEGLIKGKKVLHIHTCGAKLEEGAPVHSINCVNETLAFVGITDVETLYIHGQNQEPDKADDIKAKGIQRAIELAKKF